MNMNRSNVELSIEEQAHRTRLRDLYCGVFVTTVIVWVLRFCLGGLANLATASLNNYYLSTTLTLLAESISVFLPFYVFLRVQRDPLSPVFREKPRSEHPVLRTVLGVIAMFGLSFGAMELLDWLFAFGEGLGLHSTITVPDMGQGTGQTLFYVVLSSVLYAFSYEIAFRGITIRAIRDENRLCAILVSGVAFAFCDAQPYGIAVRLAVGFILGAFYLRVRSVWACIVLQLACQVSVSLWNLFFRGGSTPYSKFLLLLGLVFGIAATFFLFFPSREADEQKTSNKVAIKLLFTSFGIYLLVALTAFSLLLFTFSTDADPADPLLQPTPEDGHIPPLQFDRDEELGITDSDLE